VSALSDALNAANDLGWSAREISRRTGGKISHSVVADYLNGRGSAHPKEYVLAAFAEVFPRLTVQMLRELAGLPAGEKEPYEPPEEAHRLTARQRRAVDELIRLLAERAGGEHGGDTAATSVTQLTPREKLQQVQKKAARRPSKD
jgi:hypothetical protein